MKMRAAAFAFWIGLAAVTIGTVAVQATVSTTAPRNDYVGTGATATYSYTFRIFAATDLRVTTRNTAGVETTLTYPTDYTVTGVNRASGGTIVLTAGNLTTDYALTIRFDRTPRQSTDLRNQGSFLPQTHEDKFDELTRYSQQLEDVVDRSLHLPETEVGTAAATTLPAADERASKFLSFDASGNVVMAAGTSANLGPVSSYIDTLLDDTTAAAARTTLGVPANVDGTVTDTLTITGDDSGPTHITKLLLNTTHATKKRAQIQYLQSGTTKWTIASDFDGGGVGDNNLTFYNAELGFNQLLLASDGVVSVPLGKVKFPATQSPSSDVNTLDDYEEGTWTPAITAAVAGNLSVSYTTQLGSYVKIGRSVTVNFSILTSAFTHTTASGAIRITGLPFAAASSPVLNSMGTLYFSGLTKANYTQFVPGPTFGQTYAQINASGSAQAGTTAAITDFPTGGTVVLAGTITYLADN